MAAQTRSRTRQQAPGRPNPQRLRIFTQRDHPQMKWLRFSLPSHFLWLRDGTHPLAAGPVNPGLLPRPGRSDRQRRWMPGLGPGRQAAAKTTRAASAESGVRPGPRPRRYAQATAKPRKQGPCRSSLIIPADMVGNSDHQGGVVTAPERVICARAVVPLCGRSRVGAEDGPRAHQEPLALALSICSGAAASSCSHTSRPQGRPARIELALVTQLGVQRRLARVMAPGVIPVVAVQQAEQLPLDGG